MGLGENHTKNKRNAQRLKDSPFGMIDFFLKTSASLSSPNNHKNPYNERIRDPKCCEDEMA